MDGQGQVEPPGRLHRLCGYQVAAEDQDGKPDPMLAHPHRVVEGD